LGFFIDLLFTFLEFVALLVRVFFNFELFPAIRLIFWRGKAPKKDTATIRARRERAFYPYRFGHFNRDTF